MTERSLFVELSNARLDEQKRVMQEILRAGHCPFCEENLLRYHVQPIIKLGEYWLWTYNQWPYEGTKFHFLFILRTHARTLADVLPGCMEELARFVAEAERRYDIQGGALAMRFGDPLYTGATVVHLHAHLIVPLISEETGRAKVISFPIG